MKLELKTQKKLEVETERKETIAYMTRLKRKLEKLDGIGSAYWLRSPLIVAQGLGVKKFSAVSCTNAHQAARLSDFYSALQEMEAEIAQIKSEMQSSLTTDIDGEGLTIESAA